MVALCANGREPNEGWDMSEAEESAQKLYEVWIDRTSYRLSPLIHPINKYCIHVQCIQYRKNAKLDHMVGEGKMILQIIYFESCDAAKACPYFLNMLAFAH
jgi:hypothetical protein